LFGGREPQEQLVSWRRCTPCSRTPVHLTWPGREHS